MNQNEKRRGNGSLVLIIVLVAVLAVMLGVSSFFLIKEIHSARNDGQAAETIADKGDKSLPETTEEAENGSGKNDPEKQESSKTTLIVSDTSEIGKTDVKNGVQVIDVSELVENVMPSVVSVVDNLEYTSVYNPYNFFFGGSGSSSSQEAPASGSGIIIGANDTELLIVTNNHVVSNEESTSSYVITSKGILVTFVDGTSVDASVKGTDAASDLAVIAVKLSEIPEDTKDQIKIAVVGNSDTMRVGEGVIAIGNAGGYGQSVTFGVLSAKDREVTIDGVTRKLLQTDAAINPGNSGGGMFNKYGELIGINCAKAVSTDIEGMGFAIPISSAQEIIEDLMNKEPIEPEDQGFLGIRGESIPENYQRYYGYPAGVSVSYIEKGSKAGDAGIQRYDIITNINGKAISSMEELRAVVNGYKAGTKVSVTVQRITNDRFKVLTFEVELVREADLNGE